MGSNVIDRVTALLEPILDRSGSVFFSGQENIAPGKLYVLGYNPGGPVEKHAGPEFSIRASLSNTRAGWSEYVDGQGSLKSGFYPNVLSMFQHVGADPTSTLSTNAIFERTSSSGKLKNAAKLWSTCWPVHQLLLSIVRPRVIVCLGGKTFDLLKIKSFTGASVDEADAATGDGWIRREAVFEVKPRIEHRCLLLGLPHPGGAAGNRYWNPFSVGATAKLDAVRDVLKNRVTCRETKLPPLD